MVNKGKLFGSLLIDLSKAFDCLSHEIHVTEILRLIHSYVTKMIEREAVSQRCSVKKVFLEISHNSQENIYQKRNSGTGVFL